MKPSRNSIIIYVVKYIKEWIDETFSKCLKLHAYQSYTQP